MSLHVKNQPATFGDQKELTKLCFSNERQNNFRSSNQNEGKIESVERITIFKVRNIFIEYNIDNKEK